ncbi:MAG: pentapeptide repeat-containing protein, partial [Pseudomonadota bacterium]
RGDAYTTGYCSVERYSDEKFGVGLMPQLEDARSYSRSYIELLHSEALNTITTAEAFRGFLWLYQERFAEGRFQSAVDEGEFAERWRDYERAADAYRRAVDAAPDDAEALAALGVALHHLRDDAGAERALEAAIPSLRGAERAAKQNLLNRSAARRRGALDQRQTDYGGLVAEGLDGEGYARPGLNLSRSQLEAPYFRRMRAPRASFYQARTRHADLEGAFLPDADFTQAEHLYGLFRNAHLVRANLSGAQADTARFTGADLSNAKAQGLSAFYASFAGARLRGANFAGASLSRARFVGAKMNRTNLKGADLSSARLMGVDLTRAALSGANLHAARIDCDTRLPPEIDAYAAGLISVERSCDGVAQRRDFSGVDWEFADLSGLNLDRASFEGSSVRFTSFSSARLRAANFEGVSGPAGFFAADLRDASFVGAQNPGNFFGNASRFASTGSNQAALLENADFSGATLEVRAFIGRRTNDVAAVVDQTVFDAANLSCGFSARYGWRPDGADGNARSEAPSWPNEGSSVLKFKLSQAEMAQREAQLARQIAEAWPSASFDKTCAPYFEKDD